MWEIKKKYLSSLRKNKALISFLLVHVNIAKCCLVRCPLIYIYMCVCVCVCIYIIIFIYFSFFGFAGSSLLHGLFSSRGKWGLPSSCTGFSCCRAEALGAGALVVAAPGLKELQLLGSGR